MEAEGGSGRVPPGLFTRLDDLWFENYAAWARAHPRGRVQQTGGWRIASLASPWPFYNVATAVEGQDPDPTALRAAFAGTGGYRVWLREGMEVAESALRAAGFLSELEVPAYLLELTGARALASQAGDDPSGPAGYQLGRAVHREELEEVVWGELRSPWRGVDDGLVTFPDPWAMAQDPDRRFYQARQAGRLVASGQSLLHAGLAGVYGMWTAEGHRGRGLASALLGLILRDGAKTGAEYATLQSAHPGGGLYATAGFRQRYAYRVYRDRL